MRSPSPPPPGPHGGDGAAIAAWLGVPASRVLDLSASLNPFPPDVPALVTHHAASVRRYGDVQQGEERLATAMAVDPTLLVLTNGGSEAISLVADLMPRGDVQDPEFSLYRRHLREVVAGAPRWRSNPHSPSGRLAAPADQAAVWDEAYWPLATGSWTRGDHLAGSVVVGSLTKLYACPGLRLGYVLAPERAVAEQLRSRRPEWSVGALALDVLTDLLARADDLPDLARRVADARQALTELLAARGWTVAGADAPWVLVRDAAGLRDHLARQAIVVRDCASFGLPGTVRIAVPDAAGLEALADAVPHPSELDRAGEAP